MSASSTIQRTTARRGVPAPDAATLTGGAFALGCTLVGQYVETPWESGSGGWGADFSGNGGWAALGVTVAVIAVALVLVGLTTDRARAVAPDRTAVRSLILAGLGVVSIAVFYLGIPSVLAAGAAGLALDARRRLGRLPVHARVALFLAVLTVMTAVHLAFTG